MSLKTAMMVFGIVLMLIGIIWILQGINILPGSFMTGQMQWAVYGAIAFVIGAVLLVMSRRSGVG